MARLRKFLNYMPPTNKHVLVKDYLLLFLMVVPLTVVLFLWEQEWWQGLFASVAWGITQAFMFIWVVERREMKALDKDA